MKTSFLEFFLISSVWAVRIFTKKNVDLLSTSDENDKDDLHKAKLILVEKCKFKYNELKIAIESKYNWGTKHLYFDQVLNGFKVDSGIAKVHFEEKREPIFSCGFSSIESIQVLESNADDMKLTWNIAVEKTLENFRKRYSKITLSNFAPKQLVYTKQMNKFVLVYQFSVGVFNEPIEFQVYVDKDYNILGERSTVSFKKQLVSPEFNAAPLDLCFHCHHFSMSPLNIEQCYNCLLKINSLPTKMKLDFERKLYLPRHDNFKKYSLELMNCGVSTVLEKMKNPTGLISNDEIVLNLLQKSSSLLAEVNIGCLKTNSKSFGGTVSNNAQAFYLAVDLQEYHIPTLIDMKKDNTLNALAAQNSFYRKNITN